MRELRIPKHFKTLVAIGDAYSQFEMTHLSDLSVASNAFTQGKQEYENKKYEEAVKSFTRAIEIFERDLPIALLHRAAALEMKHDYKGALKDSLRANPNNRSTVPDPYITGAHALFLCDRLPEAAAYLRAGIAAVPATSAQHSTLINFLDQVTTEIDVRNQWLMRLLPTEILDQILSLLPLRSRIRLASTCHFWNTFMLHEWTGMWSTIDTTHGGDLPDNQFALQRALEAIPPSNVRTVALSLYDGTLGATKREKAILDTMHERCWNKVENLEILHSDESNTGQLLRLTKNSLKSLKLWDPVNDVLENVVEICPNIRSITTQITERQEGLSSIMPQIRSSNLVLTRLAISKPSLYFRHELATSSSSASELTMNIINTRYPTLQELIILDAQASVPYLTATYSHASLSTGLVKLRLSLDSEDSKGYNSDNDPAASDDFRRDPVSSDQQLRVMIQNCRNSLISMKLDFRYMYRFGRPQSLAEIAKIGLPMLKSLDFSFTGCRSNLDYPKLQHLIAACPALEYVHISGSHIWNRDVLREFGRLTNLRQLSLHVNNNDDAVRLTSDYEEEFKSLVRHSQKLGFFSFGYVVGSEDFKKDDGKNILVDVASYVRYSSTIQHLDLSFMGVSSSDSLISLLNSIKDSQVRILKIRILDVVFGDKEIQAMASLRNLALLKIGDYNDIIKKEHLVRIFNEHEGGSGLFVIQVDIGNGAGFSGRKQYPVVCDAQMEGHSIEDAASCYAIKEYGYRAENLQYSDDDPRFYFSDDDISDDDIPFHLNNEIL